jgi:hypothetical protein
MTPAKLGKHMSHDVNEMANALAIFNEKNSTIRGARRSIERADRKDQVRAAKAIQIKSTRGFA